MLYTYWTPPFPPQSQKNRGTTISLLVAWCCEGLPTGNRSSDVRMKNRRLTNKPALITSRVLKRN